METDLKKIVGHRLQMLRMEKNLTQEQMGEKLNLSTSAYCKIEYGETDLTLTRLNKIAEVLNMSALELFNKIDGNVYVNNTGTIGTNIGVAKDCSTVRIEAAEDLRELIKANSRFIEILCKRIELLERHYKIFCVNGNTGFRNESRIFYFIHLQNEEAYERKESSSA